jgi:hypothetical protein
MKAKIIGVKFLSDNRQYVTYAYLCYDDVKVGDTVVVDSVNGFKLATVTTLDYSDSPVKAIREVVDVVNFEAFNARKEKAERIQALRSEMDKKVKTLQNLALYEMMAEKDPELATMLAELKELV